MLKKELRIYRTLSGKQPFVEWFESLKDIKGKALIANRLNRVVLENYGDCKAVGDGIYELRIHYGPGYRVYFSEQDKIILLLLLGGNKNTQTADIKRAKEYLSEFKERYYGKTQNPKNDRRL